MLPERFWEKIQRGTDSQCWTWLGAACKGGYGQFRVGKEVMKAHRLVYADIHGPIPSGMVVMHSCDNRRCVNPHHLSIGSPGDNNADRDRKGRQVALRGEQHGMSKLTLEHVREIQAFRREMNSLVKKMADRFGVSEMTVKDVINGKSWRSLALPS